MFDRSAVKCPVCGSSKVREKYAKDDCFVCWNQPNGETEPICGTLIGVYCSQCDELLPGDRFGFRNDAYECKKCGKIHWGYTEYKRDRAALDAKVNSYISELDSFPF